MRRATAGRSPGAFTGSKRVVPGSPRGTSMNFTGRSGVPSGRRRLDASAVTCSNWTTDAPSTVFFTAR